MATVPNRSNLLVMGKRGESTDIGPHHPRGWRRRSSSEPADELREEIRSLIREQLQLELGSSSDRAPRLASTTDIYPDIRSSIELNTAVELLSEARIYLDRAVALVRRDPIASDDEMQKLQALLPELFCCRVVLGDGFGAAVNSLQQAFANSEGVPLESHQIETVSRAVGRLQREPFLPFEASIDLAAALQSAGLDTEPAGLGILADFSDEQ